MTPIRWGGYKSLRQAIIALKSQGLTPDEIAAQIGREKHYVTRTLREHRTKVSPLVSPETLRCLRPYAEARNTTVFDLLERIVRVLAREPHLIDAVLDDKE